MAALIHGRRRGNLDWDGRNIAALFVSTVVAMTSSIDRESGASLYMVLFAVLLQFSLREAIALTAFCVFLGGLGPGIMATREAVSTERGPRPAADYASAVLLLPGIYYGISFGVIVNALLPMWLLALLVVAVLAISNVELLLSLVAMLSAKREILQMAEQIKVEAQAEAVVAGGFNPTLMNSFVDRDDGSCMADAPQAQAHHGNDRLSHLERMRSRVRHLQRRATRIEAAALLFPAFHFPTHREVARAANVDVDTLYGPGHGLPEEEPHDSLSDTHRRSRGSSWGGQGTWRGDGTPSVTQSSHCGSTATDPHQVVGAYQPLGGGVPCAKPPVPPGKFGHLRRWWAMQPKFEWLLVLKIVVLHLITEAVRHLRAHPCTPRFWFMLFVMSGLVTILLWAIGASFCSKRLWRGPQWKDALKQVQEQHALQAAADDPEHAATEAGVAVNVAADPSPTPCDGERGVYGDLCDVAPAVSLDVQDDPPPNRKHKTSKDADGAKPATAAGHGSGGRSGCCGGFKAWWVGHSPFIRGPASEAITCTTACVSQDQFGRWTWWRVVLVQVAALPLAVLGCALGFPAGPFFSWLLIGMRVKPHVIAATSRFLVMLFTFGSFVAYIISGNLRRNYALIYGAINLLLAPLGMVLFHRARLPSHLLLSISLAMGVIAMGAIAGAEVAPWLQHFVLQRHGVGSDLRIENTFNIGRFCHGHQYYRAVDKLGVQNA